MQLFETMKLENGTVNRLNYHIKRMRTACEKLGIKFQQRAFEAIIKDVSATHMRGAFRLKILIDEEGKLDYVVVDLPTKNYFTARLVQLKWPDNKEQIIYKTTKRDHLAHDYSTDLILLHDASGKLLEFDIGNVMIKEQHQFFTPKYNGDFLKGCMREALIDEGKLIERDYTVDSFKDKLKRGEIEIFLINSLREVAEVKFYL
ncbi:aminodeoxychorismate lyase [Staphylococcus gallinarum]|uniref:Aminodeoxychorismate lyase n=1 Tax=Staphylococcus gallinarum TaxID=1293 RepID=A0A3A0W3Z6_STAGA|nr:aminotransferase class IV [Staphylococcus gallinarum]RIP35951.1 aminodeoxychorismate lyase [Staphylococcus gallinarum]